MTAATQNLHDPYIEQNLGPSYHTDTQAQYILPNDAIEHERLERQAQHLSNIMDGLVVHAPVHPSEVRRVLDVGCGTGVVTEYLAREFPEAQAVGVDISPVRHIHNRPGNVVFKQGNILTQKPTEWSSLTAAERSAHSALLPDENGFDLTFSRLLVAGISDWPLYIKNCFKLVKPGGWTEIHDLDYTFYRLPEYTESGKEEKIPDTGGWFHGKLKDALNAKGIDYQCGAKAKGWMEEAGFQDIQVRTYNWVWGGDWQRDQAHKDFGDYITREMPGMFYHMIVRTMAGLVSEQEIEEMVANMQKDMQSDPGRVWKLVVTCGRKPA